MHVQDAAMIPTVKHSLTVCPVCEERRNAGQNAAQSRRADEIIGRKPKRKGVR
jgi:hypothetical protein